MKKLMLFAATALVLAGCSQDEFVGNSFDGNQTKEITFSMETPNLTRATGAEAATKLGNEFVVLGWKTVNSTASDVFQYYTVHWDGNAGQTETNQHGWEYVGKTSKPIDTSVEGITQSVKYWDYSATQYDFIAWRINGGDAIIESITDYAANDPERKEGTTDNYYKAKMIKFQVQDGDDLGKIFISDHNKMTKPSSGTTYGKVNMTFRNLAAKVRVGIYETVSGYSIKDVKFYSKDDDTAPGASAQIYSATDIPTAGNVLVKYIDETGVAVAKTTPSLGTNVLGLGTFTPAAAPEYKETGTFVGRTSTAATLSGGDFTFVFPSDPKQLSLKVDYTLESIDGKGETIKVTGAKATIPEQYGEWKANFAYTYLFKIADNTGGTTGGDPTTDPKGLYPIVFDAVVTEVQNAEEGTVTSMSDPTITTYQKGVTNGVYTSSTTNNIWVSANVPATNADIELTPGTNLKLYTAISTDGTAINEKNVANYANNGIVLTDVTAKLAAASAIPGGETADGFAKTCGTNEVAKFLPENNKAYVIELTYDGKKFYKVITIGTPAATYTIKAFATGSTTSALATINEGESFDVYVNEGSEITKNPVLNAADNFDADTKAAFTITEVGNGKYTFTAKAGVTGGAKAIKVNGVDGSTSIDVKAYDFVVAAADLHLDAGSSEATNAKVFKLQLGTSVLTGISETNFRVYQNGASADKLTITPNADNASDGTYDVAVAADAKGTYTIVYGDLTNNLASFDVTINTYAFTSSAKAINIGGIAAEKFVTLNLKLGGNNKADYTVGSTTTSVATLGGTPVGTTDADGNVTLTGVAVGNAVVTAPGASITVPVYNFNVTVVAGDATTKIVTFKNGTTAANVTLTPSAGTLVKTATTGVYTWTVANASDFTDATIKYTYNGQTFTLHKVSSGS